VVLDKINPLYLIVHHILFVFFLSLSYINVSSKQDENRSFLIDVCANISNGANFMKIKKSIKSFNLVLLLIVIINFSLFFSAILIPNSEISEIELKGLRTNSIKYENATVISDGYDNIYWNSANSEDPRIAVDGNNKIHVVWQDGTDGVWGTDYEIMYVSHTTNFGWSNVSVISDGYNGVYWNDGYSADPAIAIDSQNVIHVVFEDGTDGQWGVDYEIMYVYYSETSGWSNITVISDGYSGAYWNDGNSYEPSIAVDNEDNLHVVWYDYTDGVWGTDTEIMYAKYTQGVGWSNVTIISDGYNGIYWNEDGSFYPKILSENGNLHVVWYDFTDGVWGSDSEIMYAKYTQGVGWSNVTIISDGYSGSYWNDGSSAYPSIAYSEEKIHVVWEDETDGVWGTDYEIMYASYTTISGWSNITVVSDGFNGTYWNDGHSYSPDIITDYNGNVHIIWADYTDGFWGTDAEIMYVNFTVSNGWTNVSVISDGFEGTYWNDGLSRYPDMCLGTNSIYIAWQDGTDGAWGTDYEILFTRLTIPPPPEVATPGIPFGFYFLAGFVIITLGLIYYSKRKI
jgi:hypothetical protein